MKPKFKVGFEFEFGSDKTRFQTYDDVLALGISGRVTDDYSIKLNRTIHDCEIVTDPVSLKESSEVLSKVFRYMDDNNVETNKTTGIHINISCGDRVFMRKIDPETLIAASDDFYIAKQFKRDKNIYCKPWNQIVKKLNRYVKRYNKTSDSYKKWNIRTEFTELVDAMFFSTEEYRDTPYTDLLEEIEFESKYMSVNINNLVDFGYVEYRMIGGRNYHHKIDEIQEAIDHFCLGQLVAQKKDETRIERFLEWSCK